MSSIKSATPSWFHVFQEMVFDGTLSTLDGGALKTYIAIKGHAGLQDGICWPGLDRIGKLTGHSPRQVQRHLEALERAGLLSRERQGRKNRYRIIEKFSVNGSNVEWQYRPFGVRGLGDVLEHARSGQAHPELHIRLETTTTTTTTATVELIDPRAPSRDLTSAQGIDGRMGRLLEQHLRRIKPQQNDDMGDI
ncbi:helix-turn-helix domain-containing protein [Pseudomonas sp. NPDC079086]|uniref:helix-turn-helix domain-containing protein n=1 Tax=unclassified Pseudomonas TaxID=196821 RepID=UPI0037C53BE7